MGDSIRTTRGVKTETQSGAARKRTEPWRKGFPHRHVSTSRVQTFSLAKAITQEFKGGAHRGVAATRPFPGRRARTGQAI